MPGEFAKLLARLAEAEVRCIVVGDVAACLHGMVHATPKLELLVEASGENARRLLDVLAGWGEGWARELSVADLVPAEAGALRIEETDFVLDLFTTMRLRGSDGGLSYAQALEDARTHALASGQRVVYLSAERLIECKTGTGRPKDVQDIEALREILRGGSERSAVNLETLQPMAEAGGAAEQGEWPLGT